jgi:hypothetical protein
MTDLETELREAMRATVAGARPPRDVMELLLRRRRRRRTARLAAMSAAAAVVVAAVPTSVALLDGGGRPAPGASSPHPSPPASPRPTPSTRRSPPAPPPPRGWVRHRDSAGDFIDTPAAWHVNGLAALVSPIVRWVIGTGPVRSGGGCAPTAALRQLPTDGALFQVIEYGGRTGEPYTFPPRASPLGLGPLGGPFECWGVKTHLVLFEDGGRYFQVQTVFGSRAPASLRAEVTRSLNALHIAPLPASEQPAVLCHAGQWTYCPQAAWAYEVINKAHVLQLGNQGTRALFGGVGERSFALWTTPRRGALPGGQCRSVSGTKVCRAGNRLVWGVHGLLLWLAPALSPYSTPPTRPSLPTSRALRRLVEAAQGVRVT